MKICVAQTKPITGDIQANIAHHKKFIDLALLNGAEVIIFPELSLTGYEPKLAAALAVHPQDRRFDEFQNISNAQQLTIGVGLPTKNGSGICISLLLFQPHQRRRTYSKKYLHADEVEFFVSGQNFSRLNINQTNLALAICYELSVPEHAAQAAEDGAEVYVASVAKFASGVDKALSRLLEIAHHYSMPVLMANSIGPADGGQCAGQSSVWNDKGLLLGQLDSTHEGIIVFDTSTQALFQKTL